MSLSGKQKAFINAYLGTANFNATEAARLAGYAGDDTTLAVVGYENLRKPQIKEAVQTRLSEAAMTADENLMHVGEIARQVISPAFFFKHEVEIETDEEGNEVEIGRNIGLDWKKLESHGHLVKSISFTANGPKIELYDRLKALELIGKHHGSFSDTTRHTGPDGGPQETVNYTVDEWRAEQEKRRRQVAETLAHFDDEAA